MNDLVFEAGHLFFKAGHPGDAAFLILDGTVELTGGADARPRRLGPGDVFGEMALVDERPRETSARAIDRVVVRGVLRQAFEAHLMNDPRPIRDFLRTLFEHLRANSGSAAAAEPDQGGPAAGGLALRNSAATGSAGPKALTEFPVAHGESSDWSVVIHPLTRKAAETLPEEGLLVTRFPLRLGRASADGEREAMDLNDVWLLDEEPFQISRNHCEIFVDAFGPAVRDRGSFLGCIVNERPIGAGAPRRTGRLEPGDNVVVVGSPVSPYQFRVVVEEGRRPAS